MSKSKNEILDLIKMCLNSARKQLEETDQSSGEYLRGYIAALEFIIKESGEDEEKKSKVTIL